MKALNVLVVDDAAFIRDLIKKALRDSYPSFKIHEAADGRKAQSVLKSNPIDLVLCDWEMPEMSGLEVITWMREEERYQKTPFMMITSRGERDHVIKAVTAGVNDYIGKPFTRDNFLTKVNKLLAKYHNISAPDSQQNQSTGMTALMGGLATQAPKASVAQGSAAALMGQAPKTQAKQKPSTAPVNAPIDSALVATAKTNSSTSTQSNANNNVKKGGKAKGIAELRFGSGGTARCVIKDINLQEMSGVFKREGEIPQLLEQVVLDIVDQDAGQVARINCYIRMLQAVENNMDATTIKVVIRYVDDDPQKLETLSRFIAKVR